jgi:hypothetical protein
MSKFVGPGPSSYKKRIYRAAVSQRLRNTAPVHDHEVVLVHDYEIVLVHDYEVVLVHDYEVVLVHDYEVVLVHDYEVVLYTFFSPLRTQQFPF